MPTTRRRCDGEDPHQGGDIVAKNNLAYNNTANYCGTNQWQPASTNNLSGSVNLDDAPGTNAINGVTVQFFDETARDFHVHSSDTGAKDAGVDLSADAGHGFSRDIDGEERPDLFGLWDLGADEGM